MTSYIVKPLSVSFRIRFLDLSTVASSSEMFLEKYKIRGIISYGVWGKGEPPERKEEMNKNDHGK